MPLSYTQMENVYAALHRIADSKRVAFRARLKHFQRLGFPPGSNTGTGKRAEYGADKIFLLGIGLEMLQLGVSPERTVSVISGNMMQVAQAGRFALSFAQHQAEQPDGPHSSWFLRFDPTAFTNLMAGQSDEADHTFWYVSSRDLSEWFLPAPDEQSGLSLWPRVSLLNVSSLIMHVYSLIHEISPELAIEFESDLQAWFATYPEETDGID